MATGAVVGARILILLVSGPLVGKVVAGWSSERLARRDNGAGDERADWPLPGRAVFAEIYADSRIAVA
jgi:hypothetical protein